MKEPRSHIKLNSFVAYCIANPEQRFWQSLRNWAGVNFILFSKKPPHLIDSGNDLEDTFYIE